MIVKDVMTTNPVCVESTALVSEAAQKLFEKDIRHLPVVQAGELIGILSDRDLQGNTWAAQNAAGFGAEDLDRLQSFASQPVSELMSGGVLSVGADDSLVDAIDIMVENKVGAVAVLNSHDNKLIGIVSYIDVLQACKGLLTSA